MIRYFPTIYPDELLYSAYSRYYCILGKGSVKTTFSELFGCNNMVSVINLPCHLDSFLNQFKINDYYTAEDIIFKFTMLPIYFPFLDSERQIYSINTMKSNNGKGISMKLGVMASSLNLSQYLKYCPDCICEDIKKCGEAFWHRSHNVEGISICYKHNKLLRTHCPVCNEPINPKDKYKLVSLEDRCKNGHDLSISNSKMNNLFESNPDFKKYVSVAKTANYILNINFRDNDINIETLCKKYIYKLSNIDLITPKGNIRQKELKEQFISYYGSNFLINLGLNFNCNDNYTWLEELLHKKFKASHPIKHILLINFLCNNHKNEIKNLLTGVIDYSINPFGKAPWPCLNPVADHYLKDIIVDCKITTCSDTRKPVGTFKCNCGFIYSRRGPDITYNDKYKLGRIKTFGQVWEDKLKNIILTEGGSLNSIAKKMKADPATIKKYTTLLGLKYTWKSKSENINTDINNINKSDTNNYNKTEKCVQYSSNIQNFILTQVEPTNINQVRKNFKKEYTYLYRNNKSLLDSILKKCTKSVTVNYKNNRVNWKDRDMEFYNLITEQIKLISSIEKPIRITKSRIGRDLGISSILEQHIDKLPMTQSLINEFVESIENFQIRRVKSLSTKMFNNGDKLVEWKIYRVSGIKKTCSEKVRLEISKILHEKP